MLDTLKQAGKHISRSLSRTWKTFLKVGANWFITAATRLRISLDVGMKTRRSNRQPAHFPRLETGACFLETWKRRTRKLWCSWNYRECRKKTAKLPSMATLFMCEVKKDTSGLRKIAPTTLWSGRTVPLNALSHCRETSIRIRRRPATQTAY